MQQEEPPTWKISKPQLKLTSYEMWIEGNDNILEKNEFICKINNTQAKAILIFPNNY